MINRGYPAMRHFRKILGSLLLFIVCSIFGSFSICHAESLWLKLEKEIGFTGYQQLVREKQVLRLTSEKQRQLERIFTDLTARSNRRTEINFTLTVVADPEINAYALPGGYVIVNSGLLEFTDKPGDLAAALAHEIGHIDCKHGINAVSRTIGLTLALQLLANRTDHPDRLTQLGAVAIVLSQRGYSRNAEYQADRTGVRLLKAAGYSPEDMARFFSKLEQQSGDTTGRFFLWKLVDTHPPFPERIKRIRQSGDFFSK
jgi:predicted Zn-dependent protease